MRIATQELYTKNNNTYRINDSKLQETMKKLSTGLRINKASDDSAGLMISERFRAKVNGLKVSNDNISHANNMLKTAEGGLQTISDMIQRIRELTLQAQNGTYTNEQKQSIQNEVNQILSEIDHIITINKYNNMELLHRDGGVRLDVSPDPTAIRVPGATFIPTTATQPRTYDMSVQVDGFNFNSSLQMARLFQTHTGYIGVQGSTGEIVIRPDGPGVVSFGVKMPIGEKTRLTVVYDGSEATLYLNGEKKSTLNVAGMTSTLTFAMGDVISAGNREGISGTFYDANYYERALTQDEVVNNYNGNTVSGAAGTWDFEETSGTTVLDKSGNGNNGNMIGNTTRTPGSVNIHTGDAANDSLTVTLTDATTQDLGLTGLDVTDINALMKIDNSIEKVNNKRIKLGAQVNRLEFGKQNVETSLTNHSDTLGKIESLDIARESSELIKYEMISESSRSMLSQAKRYYENSLSLLKG